MNAEETENVIVASDVKKDAVNLQTFVSVLIFLIPFVAPMAEFIAMPVKHVALM
jgi:hypothetical protein